MFFPAGRHLLVIELKGKLEVDFGRDVAVGIQHGRFDGDGAGHGLRHPQRVFQPAGDLRHFQPVERVAQDALVVGEVGQLAGRRRNGDQAQPLIGKQVVDQLADFLLGLVEPRLRLVSSTAAMLAEVSIRIGR